MYATEIDIEKSRERLCLKKLFIEKFKNMGEKCSKCSCTKFSPVIGRRCYECNNCGYQIYPAVGTIMGNSKIKLHVWFDIIKLFINSRGDVTTRTIVSAYNISRGTVWKILMKIRTALKDDSFKKLAGRVYMDETYLIGKESKATKRRRLRKSDQGKSKSNGRNLDRSKAIFGILEENGRRKMWYVGDVRDVNKQNIHKLIKDNVEQGTIVHHDSAAIYDDLKSMGYEPKKVPSKRHNEFRMINNNQIEATWSRMKRSFKFRVKITSKYLQHYIDTFCFFERESDEWAKRNSELIQDGIIFGRTNWSEVR